VVLMNWQSVVERTVTGLGYDMVGAEKTLGGLLRVYVDHLYQVTEGAVSVEKFITVEDCEKITRQLQYVLEVEGCTYERLEVSSPGLDRPLNKTAHYERFVGQQVEVTLKLPFKGRKKYRGELQKLDDSWRLVVTNEQVKCPVKGRRVAPACGASSVEEGVDFGLDFSLEEVREARLVPVFDFKGSRFAKQSDPQDATDANLRFDDEADGDRIQ
jgi:ribosome maturation factor RimP